MLPCIGLEGPGAGIAVASVEAHFHLPGLVDLEEELARRCFDAEVVGRGRESAGLEPELYGEGVGAALVVVWNRDLCSIAELQADVGSCGGVAVVSGRYARLGALAVVAVDVVYGRDGVVARFGSSGAGGSAVEC